MGHVELLVNQHPQVLVLRAALHPFITLPNLIPGVAPAQVQDLAPGLVEPHEVCTGPLLKPVHVPLDGMLSLRCVNQKTVIFADFL